MTDFSFIANAHPSYIENLYDQYQADPQGVEQSWAAFFKGFEYAGSANGNGAATVSTAADTNADHMAKELKLLALIKGYRDRGHLLSKTNPIRERRNRRPAVNIEDYGLSEADMNTVFYSGREIGLKDATLQQIIDRLQVVYTGKIGFEYHHIANRTKRRWMRTRIEEMHPDQAYGIPLDKKKRILEKLNGATIFENFLHTKYVGQKRFSLEGGESAIVALDAIINEAAQKEAEEIVIGMAHRGRLNVLANIMGKTYAQIFNEFEGNQPKSVDGDGDVKYHLGYSSQVEATNGKTVYLKLAPNPSHLEAVGPVVTGFARAKADNMYNNDYDTILPIIIHGDAALAGQGVVFETVQMSHLEAYKTGGTIHIVINNQVGFTTDFTEARTSTYSTGVARIADAPVFHVNGDDPEAVLYCCELALRYRQEFNADVFIDIVGYRRHGHNEGDDPEFTQPEMYKNIKNHPNTRELYVQTLVKRGDVEKQMADELEENFRSLLQERLDEVRENKLKYEYQDVEQVWRKLKRTTDPEDFKVSPVTGTTDDKVELILDKLVELPEGFKPIRKVKRLFKNIEKARADNAYDWGMGELLAYGTLLMEGHNVRMSGQDVRRGTFSHRHAVLSDAETYGKTHNRLATLTDDQAKFRIFNSHLSEYAVLGFEYGYAMASPNDLVLWEAQFGDFSNGAQIIYDQFVSAAESKWGRMNGLVCLLPHGYEGQGPEHSSARLERFLQLCAEFNMTVANVTLPANFFHLLRRQLERPFRKPLMVMSPKSLLRHPECVSPKEDFLGETRFQELLDDPTVGPRSNGKVQRILLCSGKIYFDLAAYKRENKRDDVAIVRLEQLYPLPVEQLNFIFKRYHKAADILWVQEEPSNMGGWQYIHSMRLNKDVHLPRELGYVSRKSSASPATGFKWVHDEEQKDLVERAFK